MIKTLKNTTKEIYNWTKDKVVRFKKWFVILICGSAVLAAPLLLTPVPDVAIEKIQVKYHTSELKDKYRLEKTAFILDAVDENAIQAEVGNKNSDSFEPSLTLRKWNDEVNFKVKYRHGEKEKDQKVDIENKKIKWKGKKVEVHYYDIKKGELLHDKVLEADVFEVEVILLEKPDTNIVEFDIETKGLAFYYQPELTQEEIDEGAFRPENVIGSYAVYHESKSGDYSKMGGKNYWAGKAFHIYRPKIIDSAGTEVWGELNIENNLLTVEIPQEFLDNAVYPIRHAAGLTFGYYNGGTPGASSRITYSGQLSFDNATGAAGTGDSMSAYIRDTDTDNSNAQYYLYDASLNKVTNGITDENTAVSNTASWVTLNFTSAPTLTAQTYHLAVWSDESGGPGGNVDIYYDTGGNDSWTNTGVTYNTWPASIVKTSADTGFVLSIYCTYTAGEEEERSIINIQ